MKNTAIVACLVGLSLILASPAQVLAQSDKPSTKKPAVKNSKQKKSTAKKVSNAGFVKQSDEIQALAQQFAAGSYQCELGNSLKIVANTEHPGYLMLTYKGNTAPMLPVPTNTGALRLESKSGGLVWLQLPSKSMLMNSKIGQRLADECHLAS